MLKLYKKIKIARMEKRLDQAVARINSEEYKAQFDKEFNEKFGELEEWTREDLIELQEIINIVK